MVTDVRDIPVFINCRDRYTLLRDMVTWLEDAGQRRIILLDNDGSYPPYREYLGSQGRRVIYLGGNYGHLALFKTAPVPPCPFFLSDPDLVFLGPHDGLAHLWDVAQRYPERDKVGFGLSLDGVPDFPSIEWERGMQSDRQQIAPGIFDAPVDTTFALYSRPSQDIWNSLRTGGEHVMAHPSWSADPEHLSEENAYYVAHASPSSSWAQAMKAPAA